MQPQAVQSQKHPSIFATADGADVAVGLFSDAGCAAEQHRLQKDTGPAKMRRPLLSHVCFQNYSLHRGEGQNPARS